MWSAGNALDDVLAQLLRGIDALTDCRLSLLDHACGHALHPIDDRARSLRRALPDDGTLFRRAAFGRAPFRRIRPFGRASLPRRGALLRGARALLRPNLPCRGALLRGARALLRSNLPRRGALLRGARAFGRLLSRCLLRGAALLCRGFLCRTARRAAPLLFR